MADARRDCCKDENNLELVDVMGSGDTVTRVFQCSECERKHYRATAIPKHVGVTGGDI